MIQNSVVQSVVQSGGEGGAKIVTLDLSTTPLTYYFRSGVGQVIILMLGAAEPESFFAFIDLDAGSLFYSSDIGGATVYDMNWETKAVSIDFPTDNFIAAYAIENPGIPL